MNCMNCDVKIRKHEVLCTKCFDDKTVTMSSSVVKQKFGLTNEELNRADLTKMSYFNGFCEGTMYLIAEVLQLADKLTKKNDITDARRQKYLKQKGIYDTHDETKSAAINRKKVILDNVSVLLEKFDVEMSIGDQLVMKLLNKYINDPKIPISDAMKCIVPELESLVTCYKNKEQIDAMITKDIPKTYRKDIYKHNAYQDLINNRSTSIDNTFKQLQQHVQSIKDARARKRELDDMLAKSNCKVEDVDHMDEYEDFCNNGTVDIYETYRKLMQKRMEEYAKYTHGEWEYYIRKKYGKGPFFKYQKGDIVDPKQIMDDIVYDIFLTSTRRWPTVDAYRNSTLSKVGLGKEVYREKSVARLINDFNNSNDIVLEVHYVRYGSAVKDESVKLGLHCKQISKTDAGKVSYVVSKVKL